MLKYKQKPGIYISSSSHVQTSRTSAKTPKCGHLLGAPPHQFINNNTNTIASLLDFKLLLVVKDPIAASTLTTKQTNTLVLLKTKRLTAKYKTYLKFDSNNKQPSKKAKTKG